VLVGSQSREHSRVFDRICLLCLSLSRAFFLFRARLHCSSYLILSPDFPHVFAERLAYEATLPPPPGCLPLNVAESPESIILNSKMNGQAWPFTSRTALPHSGLWSFDYVHKSKPPADAAAMPEDQFLALVGLSLVQGDEGDRNPADNCINSTTDPDTTASESPAPTAPPELLHPSQYDWRRVQPLSSLELQNEFYEIARELCRTQFFSVRQALMLVTRLGILHHQIDIIVSLWSRIIDWHGFDQVRFSSLRLLALFTMPTHSLSSYSKFFPRMVRRQSKHELARTTFSTQLLPSNFTFWT
jgi:hypothetical protein